MQDYQIDIDYHEIKEEITIDGKQYAVICAFNIYFDIDVDNDDFYGREYNPRNVEVDVYEIWVYEGSEEMPQEIVTQYVKDWVNDKIDWRFFQEKMVERYKECV